MPQEEPLGTWPHSVQFTGAILGEGGTKINRNSNTSTQVSSAVSAAEVLAKREAPFPSAGGGKMALLSIANKFLKMFQKIIPNSGTQIEP